MLAEGTIIFAEIKVNLVVLFHAEYCVILCFYCGA